MAMNAGNPMGAGCYLLLWIFSYHRIEPSVDKGT
jgi:hypothetical protein